jgi:hypothetical protein
MHEFSKGSRACLLGKFFNLDSLKCHFLDFGEIFYRILMVRKRHCAWGPPFGPLGLGALGFARPELIVVMPLN